MFIVFLPETKDKKEKQPRSMWEARQPLSSKLAVVMRVQRLPRAASAGRFIFGRWGIETLQSTQSGRVRGAMAAVLRVP